MRRWRRNIWSRVKPEVPEISPRGDATSMRHCFGDGVSALRFRAWRRWPVLFLLPLWAVVVLAGCLSRAPDDERAVLRIGTVADRPPLAYVENRRWRGVESAMARALAFRLQMSLEWRSYPEAQLEPALRNGDIDVIMAGYAVTDARRATVDFASPYLVSGQGALLRPENAADFPTALDLQSTARAVGTLQNSEGDRYVRRYFMRARVQSFSSLQQALHALRGGEVDMFIYDAPWIWDAVQRHPGEFALAPVLMARTEIAWAFRRSAVSLRESANQALADWVEDGTLQDILQRWLPVSR